MRLVAAQKVLAEPFRVAEPVFGEIAHYRQQFVGQRLQEGELGVCAAALASGFRTLRQVLFVQLDEALPAVDQRWVGGGRALEGATGTGVIASCDVVVAHFLESAAEIGPLFEDFGERGERGRPLVLMTLRYRQCIAGVDVVGLSTQQVAKDCFSATRFATGQQALGCPNSRLRIHAAARRLRQRKSRRKRPRPVDYW